MTNGTTNWLNQFDENEMVAGGAAGVFTVSEVPAGDAGGAKNSQMYGFQLGMNRPSTKFQVVGRIVGKLSPESRPALANKWASSSAMARRTGT